MYDELRSKNLQLFYLTFIVRQDKKTYLSYGYPYDIHVFDEDNVLLQRIERKPDFFGRTYTKGKFTHPTGMIVSLVGARNSLLLHFLLDRENEITYVEALDEVGRSRGTVKLGDYEDDWGYYLYSFPDAVTSDNLVYVVAQTPFPRLVSFKIIRE